ncbi:hypothetical protein HOLleu_31736 [Holothuria leucospilota]|uniref:Uncharacterized protein n=1 Tax=Holothuria leucospilota TaxID=206669 RepID=A0A9Q1BHH1_HOLLE|nr:hypothetical protein HOLleu_31736 [Holothuria leucospilota]
MLAKKHKVTITQKYLVAGHTQMECDSMHSTIERKMVHKIFTERDYVVILQSARMRPALHKVRQMRHYEFMKMDSMHMASIRPGTKDGDSTVHDLRGIMYESDRQVKFKLAFSDDTTWETLPQCIQMLDNVQWSKMYQ